MGQAFYQKEGQSLLKSRAALLQIRTCIEKQGKICYDARQLIYDKGGQSLLHSWQDIRKWATVLQSEADIIKWVNYYNESQYTFETLGRRETIAYRWDQCDLRVDSYNMMEWRSTDSNLFKRLSIFVRTHITYDTLALVGCHTFKITQNIQ